MSTIETIEALRRVPGSWLSIICNGRTPNGELAWSVSVKLGSDNAQYVYIDLDEALHAVGAFFTARGIDPFAQPTPRKLKLKLKRSTP